MMAKFHELKIIILASVVLTACVLLNFAVARQNIGLMSLLAQNDYDLLNVRFIAISMTLSGFVFSSITVIFWQRRMFIPALICGFFTVGIFIYECHGVIAAFSELNAKYEESSDTSKLEKMRMELAQKKLEALEVGKVDAGDAESRLAQLQQQVLAKEEKARKCSVWQFECKNKALKGADQLAAEIDSIHAKLNHQSEYVTALSDAQSEIKASDSSENKKTFAVFQTLSRFFYDTIDYAKNLQSKLLVYMSILIVLLAQSSLAIALLLLPKKHYETDSDLSPTGNDGETKKKLLGVIESLKSKLDHKEMSHSGAMATRKEPVIMAELKRTGTDDRFSVLESINQRGHGKSNVVSFTPRTGNAPVAPVQLTGQAENRNAPVTVVAKSGNAPVAKLTNKAAMASLATGNVPVAEPVIKQATLGRLICENCNVDVAKNTANQRFCCENCRTAYWKRNRK